MEFSIMDVEIIDRFAGMPYWPAYADWENHLDCCPQCLHAMGDAGSGETGDLCTEGGQAWIIASGAINHQRDTAPLN